MKKLVLLSTAVLVFATLGGCGEKSDKQQAQEIECLELTGDKYCRNEYEQQAAAQRSMNYNPRDIEYGPTGPGSYNNYYGNPQYGSWGSDGQYRFHDPYSHQASQTNSFLLGAGLGGLAAYALTKSDWSRSNPNGWTNSQRDVKQPIGRDGKSISADEYKRRLEQSKNDQAKHKAKLKAENEKLQQQLRAEKLKNKDALKAQAKAKVPATPSVATPPPVEQKMAQSSIDAKKAELKAKQAQRQADKANMTSSGSKMQQNEQKVKQQNQPQRQVLNLSKPKQEQRKLNLSKPPRSTSSSSSRSTSSRSSSSSKKR